MSFDPVAAILAYADAKNRHDLDAVVAAFAENGIYQTMSSGEAVRGHDQLRQFFRGLFEAIPDYRGTFAPPAANGLTVAAWGHFGGTLSGPFMGFEVVPGCAIKVPVTFVCTFNEAGQLLSDVGYFDVGDMRRQTGIPMPLSNEGQAFLERFTSFWAAPTGERVKELIAPDAKVHFSGAGTVSGSDYVALMGNVLQAMPDISVTVSDYAENGDVMFIFWRASANVNGASKSWHGVDRFRLKDGMAIEEHIVFDSQILQPS